MFSGRMVVRGTQDLRQLVRTELARSTGAVGEACELDGFHIGDDIRHMTYDIRLSVLTMLLVEHQWS